MMQLDEEAQVNEQSRLAPPGAGPAQPPQGARPATPRERKMFERLVQQILAFLTSPDSAQHLILKAQNSAPEQALAESVEQVIDSAVSAAGMAGVQIPQAVRGAAAKIVVSAMAALMVKAGLARDVQTLARGALALLARQAGQARQPNAPQPAAQPQQPMMEAPDGAAG